MSIWVCAQLCGLLLWRRVEVNKSLSSIALCLMWHATTQWDISVCVGTESPGWVSGWKKWRLEKLWNTQMNELRLCLRFQTTERHLGALKWSATCQGPLFVCPTIQLRSSVAVASEYLFIYSWQRAQLNRHSLAARCLLFLFAIINPPPIKPCIPCVCVCTGVEGFGMGLVAASPSNLLQWDAQRV